METLLSSSGLMAGEEAIRGDSGLPDQQMGDLSNETITVDAQTTSPANSGREVQTNQNARADMHGSSPSNNSERSTAMDQERDRDEESCPSEKEPNITGNFMYSLGSNQNQTGETRSVMSSTGFSIFSPKGIREIHISDAFYIMLTDLLRMGHRENGKYNIQRYHVRSGFGREQTRLLEIRGF
jgi:hypothetical protein